MHSHFEARRPHCLNEGGEENVKIITARRAAKNERNNMKQSAKKKDLELKKEYDFSEGTRGTLIDMS